MRFVRLIVISFIVFFLIATAFSLLIPSHVRISKAVNIKANTDSILASVKDPARWKEWYPGLDTAHLLHVNNEVKGVYIDDKDITNPVYITLTRVDSTEIEAQYISRKMKPVANVWKIMWYATSDSTTLQWYMDFHLRWYPWEKFSSLLLEKSYGTLMEKGLSNLKRNVEN